MQIARRDFMQKSLALALSTMGSACVTNSPGTLFGREAEEARNRRRDWLSYNPRESDQVQALFTEAIQYKRVPMALNVPEPEVVDGVLSSFKAVQAKYAARKELSLEETFDLMRGSVPMLSMYAQLPTPNVRSGPTKTKPTVASDGSINIPPGTLVKFRLKGACLDHLRSAAGAGEKYRFSPSASLIDPALYPIYKAVSRYEQNFSKSTDSRPSELSQKTMWTIRETGTNTPLATNPLPEVLKHIERVYPGGVKILQRTHMTNRVINSVVEDIGKQVSVNINGRQVNMADLANPDRRDVVLDNMIRDLYKNPQPAVAPSDNRNYQPLADGLESYNIGSSELEADIALINRRSTDCSFDPSDWILTAPKVAQRVGLYPYKDIKFASTPLELYVDQDRLDELKSTKKKIEEGINGLTHLLTGLGLKHLNKSTALQDFAMRMVSPAVAKKLLGSMPILGNGLALYEFASGKNWLDGKPLNVYERLAAGFGAIPIGGVASTIFKPGTAALIDLIGLTLTSTGLGAKTGYAPKEILEVANGLKAPMATMDAWTQKQAQTMYQTIEQAVGTGKYPQNVVSAFNAGAENAKRLIYG